MLGEALPEIITESIPGPKSSELLKRRREALPKALGSSAYPICIARGEGAMVEDLDGNRFLDWIGGVGVLNIGYSRTEVVEAVKEQAEHYFHTIINIITHEGYIALAEKLNQIVPVIGEVKKTYFANSGAEADENAIKIAKAYTKRSSVICFSGAFHGRTNLTMALTAKRAYSTDMGPFPSGIYRAEYPYLYRAPKGYSEEEAIQYYLDKLYRLFDESALAKDVACIIIEPLQGEGGFVPAPINYVKALRKICDEHGILLIADEVQSGFCRTGKLFASEYWLEAGVLPDIITMAKSLGGGMPISAITAREEIMDAALPGTIGGTYCGNPLACASALQVIDIYEKEHLADKSMEIGNQVKAAYEEFRKKYSVIGDIRGLGGMLGLEFVKDRETKEPYPEFVTAMVKNAIEQGLLIENAGTYGNVIRFLAPLVMTEAQLNAGLEIFEKCLKITTEQLVK
ncbi:MAG: aspartate aminotransferase family protein [Lachnospiraceae bacterium]